MNWLSQSCEGVQNLTPYMPGKPESELKRELGLSKIVKLASNENPYGPAPAVLETLKSSIGKHLGRYPDGNGFALKTALAQHHQIRADQITLGNGSNDVLELIARVFLRPGKNAVFSQHAFAVYPIACQAVGATLNVVPALSESSDMPLGHDLTAMLDAINDSTQVVFVANPNNPTGTWINRDPLLAFLDAVPDRVVVVLDEAYVEYAQSRTGFDGVELLSRYDNLVITRTFSKAHGLAALRVGYALSNAEIADLLNRVRQPFNVNAMAQTAAETSLRQSDYIAECVANNAQEQNKLESALTTFDCRLIPTAANFISFAAPMAGMPLYQALLQKGVIARPVDNYGMPAWLRVTIGSPDENDFFLTCLEDVLKSCK